VLVAVLLSAVASPAVAQSGWPFVNVILSNSQARTFAAATLWDGQLDYSCTVTAKIFLGPVDGSGYPYPFLRDSQTSTGQAQASVDFQFNPALCYSALGSATFEWPASPPLPPPGVTMSGPTRSLNCPPPSGGGSCGGTPEGGGLDYQDPGQCDPGEPCCSSPIIVNLDGRGFDLCGPADPVSFDLNADARPERVTWVARGSRDGFLVLDRNGNGQVDSGAELLGNHTPLPDGSIASNGFSALAAFDSPVNGGNGDGIIDGRDVIFGSLRVWVDVDHNGRADAGELFTLEDLNIVRIGLDYRESRRHDVHGNLLRYWGHAILRDERGRDKRVDTCDVFFIIVH